MAVANILRVDDRESFLRDCGELLAGGDILLIYPEMGRNPGGVGELDTLAAEVALAARAPVLRTCRTRAADPRGRERRRNDSSMRESRTRGRPRRY